MIDIQFQSRQPRWRCRIVLGLMLAWTLLSGCDSSPQSVAEWPHAAVGVLDAAISDDGHYALVSSVNFGAGFWDLAENKLLFRWTHGGDPENGITAVDISADSSRAITASDDTFVIWNTNSGKPYGYWQTPAKIRATAISNKGRFVLLGLASGLVVFMDMTTGRRIEFTAHRNEAIASVALSANGQWAFTAGNDYRAILWNTQTAKPLRLFEHKTRVTQVALDHQGKKAFTSGTQANAIIWDIETGAEISRLKLLPREYVLSAARFSEDGSLLATGAPGRAISLWRTDNGERLKSWRARTRQQNKPSGAIVYAVGFSENNRYLLTESSAGWGEKWRIETGAAANLLIK